MKFLSYPVKPAIITQGFGVNGAYYQSNGINVVGHNGSDFSTYHGQPVYACFDGTAYVQVDDKGGHGVVLVSDREYEYEGGKAFMKAINWHFCDGEKEPQFKCPLKSGQKVIQGQLIGYSDSTGFSTGDHLHFGLKPVAAGENPNSWFNVKQNNGYGGCIDPSPYWNGFFAQDTTLVISIMTSVVSLLQKMIDVYKKAPTS